MSGGPSSNGLIAKLFLDGRPLAFVAAGSFGIISSLAALAYAGQASPMMLVIVRAAAATVMLAAWLKLAGRFTLYLKEAPVLLLLSCCNMGISIGVLGSVYFIPVSLSVIIFYTFPLLIAACNAALDRRRPSPAESLFFVLAFLGLLLAIGPEFAALDWRGILLACLASLASTLMFLVTDRKVRHLDDMVMSFQVNAGGTILVGLAVLAFQPQLFSLPQTSPAVWLTLAVCGFYLLAMISFFPAVRHAGSAKAALIFNAEPIVTILAAVLLLGELLSAWQWLGVALVIGTLTASSLQRKRHTVPPLPGRPV